jgi:hypothetical protein
MINIHIYKINQQILSFIMQQMWQVNHQIFTKEVSRYIRMYWCHRFGDIFRRNQKKFFEFAFPSIDANNNNGYKLILKSYRNKTLLLLRYSLFVMMILRKQSMREKSLSLIAELSGGQYKCNKISCRTNYEDV